MRRNPLHKKLAASHLQKVHRKSWMHKVVLAFGVTPRYTLDLSLYTTVSHQIIRGHTQFQHS